LKFAGVPQTRQQISAGSRPKFTILWGHVEEVLLFNNFFPLLTCALVAKIWPDKVARWCPSRWRFFASCIYSKSHAVRFRPAF